MSLINLEDGNGQITQLLTNHFNATPTDIISQDITIRISYISTINELKTAQEWRITSHQAITTDNVEITSVTPTVQSPCVVMSVSGIDSEGIPFERKLFTERDVHFVSRHKLFGYWRRIGRRARASGIPDDICQLLKILDEKDGKLQVQFVGCPKSQSEWWESDKVKGTYIEIWDEWVRRKDDDNRESS